MTDSAVVNLNNVTIANNAAGITNGAAGGVDDGGAILNVKNTIIAGNTGGGAPDCQAAGPGSGAVSLNSQGHNLIGSGRGAQRTQIRYAQSETGKKAHRWFAAPRWW